VTAHNIPLAGVIGTPIAHSRSPQIHRHWLKTHGLAGHYIPMNVAAEDLEAKFDWVASSEVAGK
jgi:shikimate dehydrogenase